jgi:hypothetical protein
VAINVAIVGLIIAAYVSNRTDQFGYERLAGSLLVLLMAVTVWYSVVRLRRMQADFDARKPAKHEHDE